MPERLSTSTVFFLIDTLELEEATIPAKEIVNKMNAITLKMISPVMVASTDLKKLFIDFFVLCLLNDVEVCTMQIENKCFHQHTIMQI